MPQKIDLTGQKFRQLTVIKLSDIQDQPARIWDCVCECGNLVRRTKGVLDQGGGNCGCSRKTNTNKKEMIGLKFGRLLVLDEADDAIEYRNRVLRIACWICVCDCGNIKIVQGHALRRGNTYSCGCWSRESRTGCNHARWRHDLSLQDRIEAKIRTYNPRLYKWRKKVLERDNYTCQISGLKNKGLVTHHLKSWSKNRKSRYLTNNGVVILKELHLLFHKIYGKGNNTKKQFQEFKKYYLEVLEK